MIINLEHDGDGAKLTTEHAASSYGIPVLVIRGEAYGLRDRIPGNPDPPELAWLGWATGEQFVVCRARRLGLDAEKGLIARFLAQC